MDRQQQQTPTTNAPTTMPRALNAAIEAVLEAQTGTQHRIEELIVTCARERRRLLYLNDVQRRLSAFDRSSPHASRIADAA